MACRGKNPADTLTRMFITRKHITGSSDRGAWPWRPWATAVWCRLARP